MCGIFGGGGAAAICDYIWREIHRRGSKLMYVCEREREREREEVYVYVCEKVYVYIYIYMCVCV